jgi:selenophosphate synthase
MNNLDFAGRFVYWNENISQVKKCLLCDAQTSGGLLICIPERYAGEFVQKLAQNGVNGVAIGKMMSDGSGLIKVV